MTRREAALLAELAGEHATEQARRREAIQLRSRDRANRNAQRRAADIADAARILHQLGELR